MLVIAALYATAPVASAETRTLKLFYIHTREKAEITYKKDGKYLPSGLKQLNHFLRDWRRNEPTKMDPRLFDLVWEAYRSVGARDYIHIVSAYRSPATNSMLRKRGRGVAEKSQHMLGKAMDFFIPGVKLKDLRNAGLRVQGGGVGYYPKSGSPFVHMDVGNVRHWPRMSRSELASVFPNGKTLHVPTDGKPLAGYDVALASYKSRKGKGVSVATEESASKGGGFLASFFGGGADEDEDGAPVGDNAPAAAKPRMPKAETVLAAAPKPKPVIEMASAPVPKPDAEVPMPAAAPAVAEAPIPAEVVETVADMVASIEMRDLPIPSSSPRAVAAIVEPAAVVAVAMAEEVVDVPVPLPRPAGAIAMNGKPAASAGGIAIESILAREDDTAGIPIPADRPKVMALASLDSATAPASTKGGRVLAAARPATALDAADPIAALGAGPATTPKASKPSRADSKPDPRPVAKPVETAQASRVLAADGDVALSEKPDGRAFAFNTLRAAPTAVYTAGFQAGAPTPNAQKFTGKAVSFMSVAKFATN